MRSIPILLAQTGTTTEDGVKQAERSRRPVAPGDRSTEKSHASASAEGARPLAEPSG